MYFFSGIFNSLGDFFKFLRFLVLCSELQDLPDSFVDFFFHPLQKYFWFFKVDHKSFFG